MRPAGTKHDKLHSIYRHSTKPWAVSPRTATCQLPVALSGWTFCLGTRMWPCPSFSSSEGVFRKAWVSPFRATHGHVKSACANSLRGMILQEEANGYACVTVIAELQNITSTLNDKADHRPERPSYRWTILLPCNCDGHGCVLQASKPLGRRVRIPAWRRLGRTKIFPRAMPRPTPCQASRDGWGGGPSKVPSAKKNWENCPARLSRPGSGRKRKVIVSSRGTKPRRPR